MTEIFDFDAGHPALDFINTVRNKDGQFRDQLRDAADFQRWLQDSGLVSPADLQKLAQHPTFPAVYQQATALRDDFRRTVVGLVHSTEVPAELLQNLNALLWQHPGRRVLMGNQVPLQHTLQHDLQDPSGLLGVLAAQMANLLALDVQGRIKKCEKHTCIRHFLDTSKNKTRRWCNMARCGNQAKAQAFYQRKVQKTAD
ncbi:CGNR zinc finger domain-containing protein [Deinococcus roseus]|uniref:Zinc finger CGNR domain-containing protein n=1 Tax=Deinococcus roseus TaxID=392414 RepID=A0ABQ2DIW0_9DEIO|nr:CGNR zinc finger domain-containing protein [Deinococcus roseus]GGJ57137.1 hypothetical protein GCM10008938_49040 [Deinococcus roseus]